MEKRKIKHSIFFITINTNKVLGKEEEEQFLNINNKFFNEKKFLKYFEHRKDKKQLIKEEYQSFHDINVKIGTNEISPKFKRNHVHNVIEISHRVNDLQLNQSGLESYFMDNLPWYKDGKKIFINIRGMGNSSKYIADYIVKDA